jgi:D-alanine-D-alanine ligase-like ATP-grasp enzyme
MPTGETFALLHQASPAPPIDGVCKPMKPGGYRDSCADIGFALRQRGVRVVAPYRDPDPRRDDGWSFPDTHQGVARARDLGATVLWANTVLFEGHPVESALRQGLAVVGQAPDLVQRFDDKAVANRLLAEHGLPVPASLLVARWSARRRPGEVRLEELTEEALAAAGVGLPAVVKPVRGRGSEGVSRVDSLAELREAAGELLEQTSAPSDGDLAPVSRGAVIVEEYLSGEECTVAVLPPGTYHLGGAERALGEPWALPPVRRFGHRDGIAPYSGVVAVSRNSELFSQETLLDPRVGELMRHCEEAAGLVGLRALVRIDCRADRAGGWRLFDVNLKPNMTGAGRPGRDDQANLAVIAARAVGWDYPDLVENLARQHWRLPG